MFAAGRLFQNWSPMTGEIISVIGSLGAVIFAARSVRDFQKLNHG